MIEPRFFFEGLDGCLVRIVELTAIGDKMAACLLFESHFREVFDILERGRHVGPCVPARRRSFVGKLSDFNDVFAVILATLVASV